uniref:Alkylated DNA repair protein AlkB homologue 8 N-terminal domain-containing protein n=1 Tax=Knipowitschia caucasica TaxID=637954 RepID=A0AAV2IZG8_KNICA
MIVDFRKSTVPPPPPSVMDSPITSVESFRFLGTTITQDLKWEPTISSLIKKAQQRMYILRQLRKAKLPAQMLVQFYTAIIESILTSSVIAGVSLWGPAVIIPDMITFKQLDSFSSDLVSTDLVYADLVSADLVSADLVSADLVSADLVSADLVPADLVSAAKTIKQM